jgi:hypothetical protein
VRSQLNDRSLGHTKESEDRHAHMSDSAYIVALVVDPEYGERLGALALDMPGWIADTPTNRSAAEVLWRDAPIEISHTVRRAITTFRVQANEPPEMWAVSVLGDIDLPHGEYSHTPPYSALEVIGAEATGDLREALKEYGLSELEARPQGFRASKPSVA